MGAHAGRLAGRPRADAGRRRPGRGPAVPLLEPRLRPARRAGRPARGTRRGRTPSPPRCSRRSGMTRTTPRPSGPAAEGFAVHPWADVVLPEPEHHAGVMAAAGQLWAPLADLGPARRVPARRHRRRARPGDARGDDRAAPGSTAPRPAGRPTGWACRCCGSTSAPWSATAARCRASWPACSSTARSAPARSRWQQHLGRGLRSSSGCWPTSARPSRGSSTPGRRPPPPVPLEQLGVWYWGPSAYLLRAVGDGQLHLGPLPGRSGARQPLPRRRRRHLGRAGRLLRRRDAADRRGPPRPRHVHLHPRALRPRGPGARRSGRARLAVTIGR